MRLHSASQSAWGNICRPCVHCCRSWICKCSPFETVDYKVARDWEHNHPQIATIRLDRQWACDRDCTCPTCILPTPSDWSAALIMSDDVEITPQDYQRLLLTLHFFAMNVRPAGGHLLCCRGPEMDRIGSSNPGAYGAIAGVQNLCCCCRYYTHGVQYPRAYTAPEDN